MKCTLPEISWHNREPVLSVHIQPLVDKFYRLATGGADCHVLIWQLVLNENGAVKIEALSDLTRHQRAVNAVRWAPNGQYLASADDDANIIIWQLKTDNIPLLEGETNDRETWVVQKVLRGHKEDIYDLCWSTNGLKLLSGSIDNTAIIWDFAKGKSEPILTDHKGFVQGVAWDPKSCYLATISTDRICRIYENTGRLKQRIQKGLLPVPEEHFLYNKDVKYFHDDTFKSFFRRLDFSPDGSLLAVPSGRSEIEDCKKTLNSTLIFAVESWSSPIAVLPTKQSSTVARFCPILFEIQEDGPDPAVKLPFRMVLAVGTDHDIVFYDTQQIEPFAYIKDIHYTRLTDLTWSSDGLMLIASSTDGYCSLITFEPNELGVEYVKEVSEAEESILEVSGCEELPEETPTKPKKLSLLEKWTVKTPKRSNEEDVKRKREPEASPIVPKRIKPIPVIEKNDSITPNNAKVPKRITPIPVIEKNDTASPKGPLLNFLKPKSRGLKTETAVILDEGEARDAWNTEEEVTKSETVAISENTEDFSLHLDETVSQTTVPENAEEKITKNSAAADKSTEIESSEPTVLKEKENVVKDVAEEGDKAEKNPDEKPETVVQPETVPTEKINVPKRRIPLITLSSPKQKKK